MTKNEATRHFEEYILPCVVETHEKDGKKDAIARREAWSAYVDALNKGGQVTDAQAFNWSNPY